MYGKETRNRAETETETEEEGVTVADPVDAPSLPVATPSVPTYIEACVEPEIVAAKPDNSVVAVQSAPFNVVKNDAEHNST